MSHRLARLLCFALCAALPTLSAKEEATPVPTEITSKHFESRSTDTEMTTLFTGDVVVTEGQLRVQSGAPVRVTRLVPALGR